MQHSNEDHLSIVFSRSQTKRLLATIWVVTTVVFLANVAIYMGWTPPVKGLNDQLNLDVPGSVAGWYKSALPFLVSLLAIAYYLKDRSKGAEGDRLVQVGWLLLAGLTLIFSIDNIAGIHRAVSDEFRERVSSRILGIRVNWTMLLFPFILPSVIFLILFIKRVFWRVPRLRFLALAGLLAWVFSLVEELAVRSLLFDIDFALKALLYPAKATSRAAGTTLFLMALIEFGFGQREQSLVASPDTGSPVSNALAETQPTLGT